MHPHSPETLPDRDNEGTGLRNGPAEAGEKAGKPGLDASASQGGGDTSSWPAGFDEAEADRFATAFKPSWAPLGGFVEITARAESQPPPAALPRLPPAIHDDAPIRVPGRGTMMRRAAALASVCVASFMALAYWGVSSSTKTPSQTQLNPATHHTGAAAPASREPAVAPRDPSQTAQATTIPTHSEPANETAVTSETSPAAATVEAAQIAAAAESTSAVNEQPTSPATEDKAEDKAEPSAAPSAEVANAAPAAAPAQPAAEERAPGAPAPAAPPQLAAAKPEAAPQPTAAAEPAAPHAAAHSGATKPAAEPVAAKLPEPAAKVDPLPPRSRSPLLVVRAVPENARLWLDGQRMSNPFDIRLLRGSKHFIEARQDGFETSAQTVRLETDAKLTVTLRRKAAPPRASSNQDTRRPRGAGFVTVSPY